MLMVVGHLSKNESVKPTMEQVGTSIQLGQEGRLTGVQYSVYLHVTIIKIFVKLETLKMYYSAGWLFENTVYKLSYSARS